MSKPERLHYPIILTNLLLGSAVSFYILFPGIGGYETIQNGKFELFALLFGGYLALMALFTAEMALIRHSRLPSAGQVWKEFTWMEKLICIYWLMTLISTLTSPYGQSTLLGMSRGEGFLTQTIYCGTFLCVARFARPKVWMVHLFSAAMTVFCFICLLQMQGYNPLGLYPEGTNYFGANVDYPGIYLGTTGNADLMAALLCLAIPVLAGWLLLGEGKSRFWASIPLVLCLVTVVQADVKAGLVGVVCGMALIVPVVLPVQNRYKKWLWLILCGVAVLVLIYAAVYDTNGLLVEIQVVPPEEERLGLYDTESGMTYRFFCLADDGTAIPLTAAEAGTI